MLRQAVATTTTLAPPREVLLQSPPNWTAVIFFAVLSGLHCCVCIPAFYHGRWEGYMSLIFATLFAAVSICAYFARYDVMVVPEQRRIRVCRGLGKLQFVRWIPFTDVHAVRLTLSGSERSRDSSLEILCDNEDIDCPPTFIPRQQALYLAVTFNVQLIKVTDTDDRSDRTDGF